MGFKVKILNVDKVVERVNKLFDDDVLRDSQLTDQIGEFAVERVRAQTRSGKDLTAANGSGQLPLSNATVQIRQDIATGKITRNNPKTGKLDPRWFSPDPTFFKPKKSNLTATGQLLGSLVYEKKSNGVIIIKPSGQRSTELDNSTEFNTNEELAKSLASRGRTFLGLDDKGIQRVKRIILDQLRRFKARRGFK